VIIWAATSRSELESFTGLMWGLLAAEHPNVLLTFRDYQGAQVIANPGPSSDVFSLNPKRIKTMNRKPDLLHPTDER